MDKCNLKNIKKCKESYLMITLFVFIQITLSYDTGMNLLHIFSRNFVVYSSAAFIGSVFLSQILLKKIRFSLKGAIFVSLLISTMFLTLFVNNDSSPISYIFILTIISSFLITTMFNFDYYMEGYQRTMLFFSLYGMLATFILQPLVMSGTIKIFPIILRTWANITTPIINMGLAFNVGYYGIQRTFSVFREPGVFQFFLLVSLTYELFLSKRKPNYKYIFIYLIALFSTFSTIGLISLTIIFIAYSIDNLNRNQQMKLLKLLIPIIVIVLVFALIPNLSQMIDRSLSKLNLDNPNESMTVRFFSIVYLLQTSFRNPIIGSSFTTGFNYIFQHLSIFTANDITGTTVALIMALGWPIGIWCNLNFYKFCTNDYRDSQLLVRVLVYVSLFLSVNTQLLTNNTILWVFILSTYMKRNRQTKPKEFTDQGDNKWNKKYSNI